MKYDQITLQFSGKNVRTFKEISITKLTRNVAIVDFLKADRSSIEVYPEGSIDITQEVLLSPSTPWGLPVGVFKKSANSRTIPTEPVVAINLMNVELINVIGAKLLVYDNEFIIKNYISLENHLTAMRWLEKKWSKGNFSIARRKSINTKRIGEYKSGIDFSTDAGDTNVYHWVTRVMPKIKFVKSLPKEMPIIFSYQPNRFQLDCLKLFEVQNPILVVDNDNASKFQSLVLIQGPWAGANPPQINWLIQECIERLPIISENHQRQGIAKKLFIYREDKWARKLINREAVKAFLIEQGYELNSVNDIGFEETAELFSSADEIVFEHGAAGIWLLFTKPGVKILEILPERNHVTSKEPANFYFWLAFIMKRKFNSILCSNRTLSPLAEYEVDLELLANELRRLNS